MKLAGEKIHVEASLIVSELWLIKCADTFTPARQITLSVASDMTKMATPCFVSTNR